MQYVGRFAPSPTGPLHIGSLVAAAASFLAARCANGRWLVRIEDIDPPREAPGASAQILKTLEQLELFWDGAVLYQSSRFNVYRELADSLLSRGLAYRCSCTRSSLRERLGSSDERQPYPGYCRNGCDPNAPTSIRLRAPVDEIEFTDLLQGPVRESISSTTGDYVIFRRDGLPAYHLAVVADDAFQSITHVVRGVDLLESTPLHLHLHQTLGLKPPVYAHVPVIVNQHGQKLSKQTGTEGIDARRTPELAYETMSYLGLRPPDELLGARPREIWAWARAHWDIRALRGTRQIVVSKNDVAQGDQID